MLRTLALNLHPQRRLAQALLAAATLAFALALPRHSLAAGATITVTTTADELNEDGDCSLREALRAANRDQSVDACAAGRAADLIGLPPGLFRLSRGSSGEDEARGGDLDILRDLTLRGAGADRTVIVAAMRDRVLDVFAPATVTVEGLSLREGSAPAADPEATPEVGGCVRSSAALTLVDVRVESCAADRAGGVASLGAASRLTLLRSVVSDNVARGEDAPGAAGGVGSDGELRLVDTTVVGNSGSLGGGIYSIGPASILRSTIAGNSALSSDLADAGLGGGIYNGGELAIEASTVSRNRAAAGGAGIFSPGGLSVADSTVAFNESHDPLSADAAGAGVWAVGFATMRGSILAANREDGRADDCAGLISLGGNLIQTPCGPLAAGDLSELDPLLGPLRPNGGHTLSHAPLDGSPAIDAGLGCAPNDQRGVSRPLGAACDIGALEREEHSASLGVALRDSFSQSGERLRADWSGPSRAGYTVAGGQLLPNEGGPIYWLRNLLGQSQAAALTLRSIDRAEPNVQGLLLKIRRERGRADWRAGAIRVAIDGAADEVRVEVYAPSAGEWRLARAFATELADGATLGARAFADGSVAAYLNGELLGVVDTRELPGVADLFVGGEGYAGLWFAGAPGAIADDFAAQ